MRLPSLWLVIGAGACFAQPPPALDWAVAQASRYAQFHNPVAAAYATGQLAALVCAKDSVAGSGLFRQALRSLDSVQDAAFSENGPQLPAASFSGLWRAIRPAAIRCDPALGQALDPARAENRMAAERRRANQLLSDGLDVVKNNPDRAAQMAQAAIEAGDPLLLDSAVLGRFLSELRDRAAELADDLFPRVLDLVVSSQAPSTRQFFDLGKYLFVDLADLEQPDSEYRQKVVDIGYSSIADLSMTRHSANPDDIRLYIQAAPKLVDAPSQLNFDPVAAFAILSQLIPKARVLGPDLAPPLERALERIRTAPGTADALRFVEQIGADARGGEAGLRRYEMTGRVLSAIREGRFEDARALMSDVDDQRVRRQLAALIDFAVAADAIGGKDLAAALPLANATQAGVKRSLLYIGMVAAGGRGEAMEKSGLAVRDIAPLAAETRAYLYSSLAAAMLQTDAEDAGPSLTQLVAAWNARVRSRRAAASDNGLTRMGRSGPVEVIDAGLGRYNFPLEVPGAASFTLPETLQSGASMDPTLLEAIVLGLRDESRLAEALNALVKLRLGL